MDRETARKKQEETAKHYNLAWWYGTNCTKCCGVFPRFGIAGNDDCFYYCEVCGKKTEPHTMPWLAERAWNAGEFKDEATQLTMF